MRKGYNWVSTCPELYPQEALRRGGCRTLCLLRGPGSQGTTSEQQDSAGCVYHLLSQGDRRQLGSDKSIFTLFCLRARACARRYRPVAMTLGGRTGNVSRCDPTKVWFVDRMFSRGAGGEGAL